MILTIVISIRRDYPKEKRATFSEFVKSFRSAIWALILPIVLIYVIVFGIATATEAAALAAVYAFLVGTIVYRTLSFKKIVDSLVDAVYGTAIVMFIVSTSTIFTWVLISEGIPKKLAALLLSLGVSDWALILLMVFVMLLAGMVIELVPNLFIFIPIFFPIAQTLGMDPLHFSIVMLSTLALGLFTPPVGSTLYISIHLAKIDMEDTVKDIMPFFFIGAVIVLLITYIPSLTLWVPNLFVN